MTARDLAAKARAWLAVVWLCLRRRLRRHAITTARMDRIEGRVDAIFAMMQAATEELGLTDGEPADDYEHEAVIQRRRAEMRLVRTEAGQ